MLITWATRDITAIDPLWWARTDTEGGKMAILKRRREKLNFSRF
jgi:hypothetical protein